MYHATIEKAAKAATSFRAIFTLIGILTIIGGVIAALSISRFFQIGLVAENAPIFLGLVIGSLLSGLMIIYIGKCVYSALDVLCLIAHNTEKKQDQDF